jgi:hypothetical protein
MSQIQGIPTIDTVLASIINSSQANNIGSAQYILNSDYSVVWSGSLAVGLNEYNKYLEGIAVPSRSISTNESRTANSLAAKIATETTIEDMEVTWRLTGNMGVYKAIENWMSAAKSVSADGSITTGYFDDYCVNQQCQIGISRNPGSSTEKIITTIKGLYPTNLQAIQFSADGGEYLKVIVTFACYRIEKIIE